MDLPLVLDIAIGLIFIYLILSLLASEIQEIITTLLQWRAEHLKKSIEVLLTGENSDDPVHQKFADELYNSPLIQSLNQEAKGKLAHLFRQISQAIGTLYRSITGTKNVFADQRSGPSYIPSESFSVALLQKLDIETLSQKWSEVTLRQFGEERLKLIEEILDALRNSLGDNTLLENEFGQLKKSLNDIIVDLVNRRTSLSNGISSATEQLSQFIDNTESILSDNHHCKEIIRGRLPYLKQTIAIRKLEPTISEVVAIILDPKKQRNLPPEIADIVARINKYNPDIPQNLKRNLQSLATNAQTKAESLEAGVLQLEREVETWFDRSMERASGVYRRNAKGIAILIGFVIAIATNSDTFHIIDRLSKDSALRAAVTETANQIGSRQIAAAPETAVETGEGALITPTDPDLPPGIESEEIEDELVAVRNAVNEALEGLPLPIGWNSINTRQQELEAEDWLIPWLRRPIGWFISGVALSMGASFWYDLLGKVVKVRNTGNTRQTVTERTTNQVASQRAGQTDIQ